MQLFKKSVSKEFAPPSESPVWGTGSSIYAALKR
jgi:hypothetical protein